MSIGNTGWSVGRNIFLVQYILKTGKRIVYFQSLFSGKTSFQLLVPLLIIFRRRLCSLAGVPLMPTGHAGPAFIVLQLLFLNCFHFILPLESWETFLKLLLCSCFFFFLLLSAFIVLSNYPGWAFYSSPVFDCCLSCPSILISEMQGLFEFY